jgi:outer membrane protein assembly factor BamB
MIWLATIEGKLNAINADGILKWSGYVAGGTINEMAFGKNGMLYFSSSDNNLYAYFSPDSSIMPD